MCVVCAAAGVIRRGLTNTYRRLRNGFFLLQLMAIKPSSAPNPSLSTLLEQQCVCEWVLDRWIASRSRGTHMEGAAGRVRLSTFDGGTLERHWLMVEGFKHRMF